ncbi:MAG TPA: RsmB/NOP family class I SAM-dependent RNA methyltransferase, partial [Alphaproteobacteria bacterium]|nr:RsmB/NOP family class I SAM-dependent RNA methyltransferase [Alphaproteobacteria bacterium]
NFPLWLRISWKSYPDRANWGEVLSSEPPLDITLKNDPNALKQRSDSAKDWAEKLGGELITSQTVRITEYGEVAKLAGYDAGAWWVQDVAATFPVTLLGDLRGKEVLDLCAAPGGKTLQLLAGGAKVTAVDSSAQRLMKLKENLARTKMTAEIQCADVLRLEPAQQYDVVLLDAPCTATGTIRRHPEILIHKQQDDTHRLAALQLQMLDAAKAWVKPGGKLLYCVCSLQREEGEHQMKSFLAANPEFELMPAKLPDAPQCVTSDGFLRVLPNHFPGGADGFFAAALQKSA